MKIDLSNPDPVVRFYFDPEDESRGWVEIRIPSPEKLTKIDKLTIKKTMKYRGGQNYQIEEVNMPMKNRLLWDAFISGWSRIVDEKGETIECTTDNKEILMKTVVKFAFFVGKKIEELSENMSNYEDVEKNLPST
ncbi:hypothetical protein LCGC14_1823040 [marine sediment metagenome]|uniref:Uncharacterized protein n=1 Tax=marine sediment metagenome TaxID=412755 RepID=A0A0F9IY28_9ZZZZ